MNFIIYDLEATCWANQFEARGKRQEIIEIGAVKMNEEGEILSRFERFVQPVKHTELSEFCIDLTSISQVDVNEADTFSTVIKDFQDWIGLTAAEDYLLCSWGFFDKRALANDCVLHGFEQTWTKKHISLKHQYPRINGLGREMGLKKALEKEGFGFDGKHHRGIDDALNAAKIFRRYMRQWRYKK